MSYCSKPPCTNMQCDGCKDGKIWCQDPACVPNCRGCRPPKGHEDGINLVFASILVILLTIVVAMLVFYGPRWVIYHDGDPKNPHQINPGLGFDYDVPE